MIDQIRDFIIGSLESMDYDVEGVTGATVLGPNATVPAMRERQFVDAVYRCCGLPGRRVPLRVGRP